jgi:hypothetical protein
MFKHLGSILMPTLGLGSVIDLFERAAEINHWDGENGSEDGLELRGRRNLIAEAFCRRC